MALDGDVSGARDQLDQAVASALSISAAGDLVLALQAVCKLPDATARDREALAAAQARGLTEA